MSNQAKKFEPEIIKRSGELRTQLDTEVAVASRGSKMGNPHREDLKAQLKRRRVPRRAVRSSVGILYQGRYQVATCFEIGEGGMLIASNEKLKENDSVVVTLLIPGVINGVMIGKVVYAMASEIQEHARYGIMFEKIDFETKRTIRNFVASATSYVMGGE